MAKNKSPKKVICSATPILTKREKIIKDINDNRSRQLDPENHLYYITRRQEVPKGSK